MRDNLLRDTCTVSVEVLSLLFFFFFSEKSGRFFFLGLRGRENNRQPGAHVSETVSDEMFVFLLDIEIGIDGGMFSGIFERGIRCRKISSSS